MEGREEYTCLYFERGFAWVAACGDGRDSIGLSESACGAVR